MPNFSLAYSSIDVANDSRMKPSDSTEAAFGINYSDLPNSLMIVPGYMVTDICSLVKLQLKDDYTKNCKGASHTAICSLVSPHSSETVIGILKPLASHRGLSKALLHGPSASELSDLLAVEVDGKSKQS